MRHAFENDEKVTMIVDANGRQPSDPTARLSRRSIARCLLPLVLLCLAAICIGQTSCVEEKSGCFEGEPNCATADWITRIEVANPRFEFVQDLPGSKDFWLRRDDELRVRYDEFSYLLIKAGHDCDFSAPSNNNCLRCNWCNQDPAECVGPHFAFGDDAKPALVSFAHFMPTAPKTTKLSPGAGCGDGYAFEPSQNSTFQLKERGVDATPIAQTNAYVISSGAPKTVTYALERHPQSFTNVVYFTGSVPPYVLTGGPGLEDNFSTNLHISRVRVLKVKKEQTLPLKGKPAEDATPFRPQRLVFIPGYQGIVPGSESSPNQCFPDLATRDGNFDLTKCRLSLGDTTGTRLPATPAYLSNDPALLTWVAEFAFATGDPPLFDAATEMLVIEFTIDAN